MPSHYRAGFPPHGQFCPLTPNVPTHHDRLCHNRAMSSTPGSSPLPPALATPHAFSPAAPGPSPVWPQRAEYLTDSTRCPACFTPLSSMTRSPDGTQDPVCSACGLDLSGTDAAGVFAAGTEILTAESRRQELLAAMRTSQAQRAAARAAAVEAANAASAAAANVMPTHPASVSVASISGVPLAAHASVAPASSHPTAPAGFPAGPSATGVPLSAWYPAQPTPPALPPSGQIPMDAGRPRRSGIQILMLTVGIILVSIMAIFFVLLAYLVASLEVRSVLTGIASVAVFGIAMLLHRRRLSGTAEGIAILAIVLLLLDVWIVRANDLFGTAGTNGWLYTGVATGLLAVALAAGFRMLPLRSLSIASAFLTPFAVFAFVLGILSDVNPTIQIWAAFAGVGAAGLAWSRIPLARFEQGVVRVSGVTAAAIAILPGSVAFGDVTAGPVIALGVLALIWFGHLALSPLRVALPASETAAGDTSGAPTPQVPAPAVSATGAPGTLAAASARGVGSRTTGWHFVAAFGLGITTAAVGPALFFHATDAPSMLWIPAVATAIGAVILALVARLSGTTPRTPLLQLAAAVPLALAPLLVAPAALLALSQTVALSFVRPFSVRVDGTLPLDTPDVGWAAPIALLLVSLLTTSALVVLRRVSHLGWVPAALGALGLIAASVALETPALTGLGFLAVSAGAVVATASHRVPKQYRMVAAATAALATFGVFVAGVANTATFPFAAVATLAVLVVLHGVVRRADPSTAANGAAHVAASAVLAAAAVVLLGSIPLIPAWFQAVTGATAAQAAPALLLSLTSLAILSAIPLTVALFSRAESATLGVIAALTLGTGLVQLAMRIPVDATPFLISSGILVAVAALWQFVRQVTAWPERFVAAVIAPLVTLWFGSVLWDQIDPAATLIVTAAAVVLLAAVALLIFRPVIPTTEHSPGAQSRSTPRPIEPTRLARICWDGAVAVASVPVIARAFFSDNDGWVALLLTAVAALIIASGEGGVFAGRTPRRHVAWVGLPLAVSALWLALARNNVEVIEYYTLPVSGLLLTILALILVRRARLSEGVSSSRTVLFSAALAIAILPSAVAAGSDESLRTIIVLVTAAALLIGGPFLPALWQGIRVAVVAWLAGASTMLLLVVVVLPVFGSLSAAAGWENEAAAASLLAGGALWVLRRQEPRILGTLAAAAAPVIVALPLAESILAGVTPFWEFFLTLVLACALFVVTSLGRFRSELVRWTALGSAVILAATAVTAGLAEPFETATVPIAIALVTAGAVRLLSDPASRSWANLGAGTALLLVPSLLADFTSTDLLRIVALGVAALGVFGAGLALKLGAPTVIGAIVLVIHALAQLWPWISGLYGAIPWWMWAGVGGVALIVFAATYEKRIRDLRAVALNISSLR